MKLSLSRDRVARLPNLQYYGKQLSTFFICPYGSKNVLDALLTLENFSQSQRSKSFFRISKYFFTEANKKFVFENHRCFRPSQKYSSRGTVPLSSLLNYFPPFKFLYKPSSFAHECMCSCWQIISVFFLESPGKKCKDLSEMHGKN